MAVKRVCAWQKYRLLTEQSSLRPRIPYLKTDIDAVCSSAFRRRDAMLVPRHISLLSTAHGCGEGDEEAPGGVPPDAVGIPAVRPGGATVGDAVSAP